MTDQLPNDERASLLPFLDSLKSNKSFEQLRQFVRVTPKGLFVDERAVDGLLPYYQTWIANESHGVAQKSIEKCRQRLFGPEPFERFYLVEGKSSLAGFLIPLPVKIPQQHGLPYYLGSLLPTSNYLHASDPVIAGMKGVELKHEKTGLVAYVSRRDKKIQVSEPIIRNFTEQAKESRYLQRRHPDITQSLTASLRTVAGIVRRSRALSKGFPIVVPAGIKRSGAVIRMSGKFLVIEEKGRVVRLLELNGRNLSAFLRVELQSSPREHLGSFHLLNKHRDMLGYYDSRGVRTSVHARAFAEFSDAIRRTRDPRERFTGWFTAGECFEKFSSFFQLSRPIERKKIEGFARSRGIEAASFRAYGGWLFALSRDGVLMRCAARHVRLPGQSRKSTEANDR